MSAKRVCNSREKCLVPHLLSRESRLIVRKGHESRSKSRSAVMWSCRRWLVGKNVKFARPESDCRGKNQYQNPSTSSSTRFLFFVHLKDVNYVITVMPTGIRVKVVFIE